LFCFGLSREESVDGTIAKLPIALAENVCKASVEYLNQVLAETITLREYAEVSKAWRFASSVLGPNGRFAYIKDVANVCRGIGRILEAESKQAIHADMSSPDQPIREQPKLLVKDRERHEQQRNDERVDQVLKSGPKPNAQHIA
jgi:hypothetical protein